MNRRRLLTTGAVAAGAVLVPSTLWWAVRQEQRGSVETHPTLLDVLCDLVIPATETPGALEVGVPAFVQLAIEHGLTNVHAPDLQLVAAALDQRSDARFMSSTRVQQHEILAAVDAAAYQQRPPNDIAAAWLRIKRLILLGYYTSEVGATQELRYELVPGRFDADIALGQDDRAWASDWVAVT